MATTESRLDVRHLWPAGSEGRVVAARWFERYRYAIFVTDLVMIVAALLVAQHTRFGDADRRVVAGPFEIDYGFAALLVELIWVLALTATDSRSRRVIGAGLEEYRRVVTATFGTFGFIAVTSYLFQIQFSRFYFVVALPVGLLLLLSGRFGWRMVLTSLRNQGRAMAGAVIVGDQDEVEHTLKELRRHPEAGYKPVAVAIVGPENPAEAADPLLSTLPRLAMDEIPVLADDPRIAAVMIAGSVSRSRIRELAWNLESSAVELIMVSRLTDVAGPRTHMSPVDGLPMVHVDLPQYTGMNVVAKRAMDVVLGGAALLVLLPLFAAVAVAIKLDDRGPVMFTQERIGQNGKPFTIHKFRTMAVDAEARMADLIAEHGGQALLFKLEKDPRVTRVGAFLRKYSIDELPQFWDVLVGNMSVVGPRPQVAREVEQYEQHVHRRLLTKPGITGLWQVSGRSTLSVEDSVRLDLRYVENWSISGDIVLILKTIRAVLRPDGAY
ncbi:sugar transferase [Georgenia deserti]|uniref:Sugar transferase n=1 Tax=Georgenia deserti TaxID=2093781 RepID=A0ABW4L1L8_9MICO